MPTKRNTKTHTAGDTILGLGHPVVPGVLRDLGGTDRWMIDRWTVRKKTG